MAYNNYFPATYQPYYNQNPYLVQPQMQQQQLQQMQQPQNVQQQPQQAAIQQSGFVRVQSENEARMYPVAPGSSVTFIDETRPYCYTKTMDMSQLDRPKFEKYRLVKEDDAPVSPQNGSGASSGNFAQSPTYAEKSELDALRGELDTLKAKVEQLGKKTTKVKKQEVEDDE